MKINNFTKSFIWNALGSGIMAFTSLFYLIIVTRINGEKLAGIFALGFASATLLYIIGTYIGRVYQVTESDNLIGDNEYIVNRFISIGLMIIVGIFFGLIKRYSFIKFIILVLLCCFRGLDALSEVYYGILQKNNRLDIVGKLLFFKSILNIVIFFLVDFFTKNVIISILGIIFINVIFLIFCDIKKANKYKVKNFKYNKIFVFKLFKSGFYTFAFTFISYYLMNISRYAIDSALDDSFQTIFGIIIMPGTFIILLSQFIFQPIVMSLEKYWINRNKKIFNGMVLKVIVYIIISGLISIIVAYFLGIPVLNFIYKIDLNNYLLSLILVLIGAILYSLSSFISNCLIIFRITKIQLFIYLFVAIIGFIVTRLLVTYFGFIGGIYGYVLVMLILFILFIILFIYIVFKKNIFDLND